MPPRTRKAPPTGVARIPKRSMGFYRCPLTGQKYRSVTTTLSQGIPKEALVFWAGNVVAESAMSNLPYLIKASMSASASAEAYDWLRRAHTRKKDERADIGSAVHKVIEHHILQTPVPEEIANDPDLAPYLTQFEAFTRDYGVTYTASEMVVASDEDLYAGTLDFMFQSPIIVQLLIDAGHLAPDSDPMMDVMADVKTGGDVCPGDKTCIRIRPSEFKACPGSLHSVRGIYSEAGLQMSAYRAAKTAWLRDGTRVDMPPTHPVGIVVHLQPTVYVAAPARCDEAVFEYFKFARRIAEWTTEGSKNIIGDPLTVPTTEA